MVGLSVPSFNVPGVVSDVRDLKTKDGKVWAHEVKVMAMGGTYGLQTQDEKLARSVGPGQQVVAVGRFEFFNRDAKFIVTKFDVVK